MSEDWRKGYQVLTESCGFMDLSALAKFSLKGPDVRKFLNGQLTNDIEKLPSLSGCVVCLLSPKGLLRADLELYDLGDKLLALVSSEQAAANFATGLSRMLPLSQSRMDDVSAVYGIFYVAGPQSRTVLRKAFGEDIPELRPFDIRRLSYKGKTLFLIAERRLRPDGYLVMAEAHLMSELGSRLAQAGAAEADSSSMEILRVEAGFPVFGIDMDEKNLPLEVRLDDAVSFDKGCYLGQETMARIHYKGHVNQILSALKSSGPVFIPGQKILAGETGGEGNSGDTSLHSTESSEVSPRIAGRVTSAIWSPKLQAPLALAMLRKESSAPGMRFKISSSDGNFEAEVLPWPPTRPQAA